MWQERPGLGKTHFDNLLCTLFKLIVVLSKYPIFVVTQRGDIFLKRVNIDDDASFMNTWPCQSYAFYSGTNWSAYVRVACHVLTNRHSSASSIPSNLVEEAVEMELLSNSNDTECSESPDWIPWAIDDLEAPPSELWMSRGKENVAIRSWWEAM